MRAYGWLFDVYPARTTMVVWLSEDDGTRLRLEDPFRPRRYARGAPAARRALMRRLPEFEPRLTFANCDIPLP
jgi:hypothetical protein